VLAGALRWLRWEHTGALFNDGPQFLWIAQRMAADDWASALAHDYHPLYPLLILLGHLLGAPALDWESAAVGVSVLCGVLSVALLYGFVRDTFGWPAAPLAAALLAMHLRAVDFSSDVYSEAPYLAAFLAALWLGWRAMADRSTALAAWAGALAGVAYLVRPEGLGAGLVFAACVLLGVLRRIWSPVVAGRWLLACALGALLVGLPYATVVRVQDGSWALTRKKSVSLLARGGTRASDPSAALGPSPAPPVREHLPPPPSAQPTPARPTLLQALDRFQSKLLSAAGYPVALLLVLGVASLRGPPGLRGIFLLSLSGLYAGVLFALEWNVGYLSRRHAFPPLVPLFGYAALGMPVLGRGLLRLGRRMGLRRAASPGLALALGLAVAVVPGLVRQLPERRSGKVATRQAAEWLRNHSAQPLVVAARRVRVAYYARARYVPIPEPVEVGGIPALRAQGATHVILSADDLGPADWAALLERGDLRLLRRFDVRGDEALLLRLLPPGDPGGGV